MMHFKLIMLIYGINLQQIIKNIFNLPKQNHHRYTKKRFGKKPKCTYILENKINILSFYNVEKNQIYTFKYFQVE